MIKLIVGKKGSGKTKKLIDLVNETTLTSKGNVVCIEKGDTLTFSISHKARLIDIEAYGVSGYGEYYGMLSGINAGNHDVTDIFGDATLRIGTRDYEELADFLDRVSALSEESHVNFIFTVSCDEAELPAHIWEIAEKI
ncbi:MAG: hypothetical protein E7531_00425 [Ruminococcaceae bacterium]|jgi:hypothetical protein|nr:hypothetical protein [Oscillospiraceae bacterium]